jgi:hypothetical protein
MTTISSEEQPLGVLRIEHPPQFNAKYRIIRVHSIHNYYVQKKKFFIWWDIAGFSTLLGAHQFVQELSRPHYYTKDGVLL